MLTELLTMICSPASEQGDAEGRRKELESSPLGQLMHAFTEVEGDESSASLSAIGEEAFQRLLTAGRVADAIGVVRILCRFLSEPEMVPLQVRAIHIACWAECIDVAREMADDLLEDSVSLESWTKVVARDALREVLMQSGVQSEFDHAQELEREIQGMVNELSHSSATLQVIGALMEADMATDECNTDTEANRRRVRDQALSRAKEIAADQPYLAMRVALDGARDDH